MQKHIRQQHLDAINEISKFNDDELRYLKTTITPHDNIDLVVRFYDAAFKYFKGITGMSDVVVENDIPSNESIRDADDTPTFNSILYTSTTYSIAQFSNKYLYIEWKEVLGNILVYNTDRDFNIRGVLKNIHIRRLTNYWAMACNNLYVAQFMENLLGPISKCVNPYSNFRLSKSTKSTTTTPATSSSVDSEPVDTTSIGKFEPVKKFEPVYFDYLRSLNENQYIYAYEKKYTDKSTGDVNVAYTNKSFNDLFGLYHYTKDVNNNRELKDWQKKYYYHEVINGNRPHKIRFDIDIPFNTDHGLVHISQVESIANILINMIIKHVMLFFFLKLDVYGNNYQLEYDDFLLYRSSYCNTIYGKASYHLIIKRFYHENHVDAKAFYNYIKDEIIDDGTWNTNYDIMPYKNLALKNIEQYIDGNIYKSRANFRMLHSMKQSMKIDFNGRVGYTNPASKEFYPIQLRSSIFANRDNLTLTPKPYYYEDDDRDKDIIEYEISHITHVHSKDHILPSVKAAPHIYNYKPHESNYDKFSVTEQEQHDAVKLLFSTYSSTIFNVGEWKDNSVILKRKKCSYCNICLRTHSKQNSSLIIKYNKDVLLKCFQNDVKVEPLGKITC